MPVTTIHNCPTCRCHPPHRPVKADTGLWLKHTIEMPRATESQCQMVASNLNRHIPSRTSRGGGYRVLNHYPSGMLYITLIACAR